ncbi:hypothetical protein JI742_11955 [Piscinibacter sp. Jin2]|uniref:Uncharacterized protein n=1 Tax=Aquariibacter lacus TaxID=2801332 RepID=A0A9X0XII6_9BURK|nr:hypothetical protein [Piscinibacter lacus]MBL0720598.1 hypothetical protein [Piscinibacter lacus]
MLDLLAALGRTLLRVIALLLGLAFGLGLLLMGLCIALIVIAWSLLRGRRPEVQWTAHRQRAGAAFRRGFGRPASAEDIVDVELREVREPREDTQLPPR